MFVSFQFVLLGFDLLVLFSSTVLYGQEESYEAKLRKHREDSLRVVAENEAKAREKAFIDKQNAVRIAYNEGLKQMRLRQDERAIQSFRKAVNVDVEGVDDTKAKAYYVEAFCQKRLRRYYKAVEAYGNAIELDPNYTEAYYGLGKTYADIGNDDQAIEVFQRAIAVDANYDKAHYELGRVYLDKKKDYNKAIESFKKTTEVNPQHDNAFTALGTAYLKQGRTQDAISALESAVAIDVKNYLASYHLASAYNQTGKSTKALESAKRALQARSNFAPAAFEAGMALKALKRYDEAKQYFTEAAKDRQWRKNAQYEIDLINDEIKRGSD